MVDNRRGADRARRARHVGLFKPREKHRAAYQAFTQAANEYPSYNGDTGRYFAAVHQLYFDPDKAEATLKELAQKGSDVGAQARMALAQRYEAYAPGRPRRNLS